MQAVHDAPSPTTKRDRLLAFPSLMPSVATLLLGEPNAKMSKFPHDMRFGTRGSISVNFEKGIFHDHEANEGGGVLDLIRHKTGRGFSEGMALLRREGLLPAQSHSPGLKANPSIQRSGNSIGRRIVDIYPYRHRDGELLFEVVRYEPKDFRQRRPGPTEGRIWKLDDVPRVIYRLPEVLDAVGNGRTIYICEGEKDVHTVCKLGFEATTCPGGAGKWNSIYNEALRDADVVLLPHNDEPGRAHVEAVALALHGIARRIRVLDIASAWDECAHKGDVSDWVRLGGGTAAQLTELVEALPDWSSPPSRQPRLRPLSLAELFELDIKPREQILDPIIPEKGLVMLYAARGTGKTHVALGIAFAAATGTAFLNWRAPKPRRVLLIDGEMPAAALQERLASIVAGSPNATVDPDYIKILAGDLIEEGGIGNLASPDVQAELEPWLEGVEFLVLDNLSSLTAVIRDNDAESWGPIQNWLLRLRRRGISVLIVHHAGKGGQQRGTSRREDVLDTSISLRRPSDYDPTQGARFEIHIEKGRGILGDAAKAFEAKLETRGGQAIWTTADIEDSNRARVLALLDDGLSLREIADETGIPRSTIHRIKKAMDAQPGGAGDGE
jgi:putative DNA primase/helicase